MAAIYIEFEDGIGVETIFQKDYPEQQETRNVVEGRVAVSTGSTMAFLVKNGASKRGIIVRDYRERLTRKSGASIKEAEFNEDGPMSEVKLTELTPEEPVDKVNGVGEFFWESS